MLDHHRDPKMVALVAAYLGTDSDDVDAVNAAYDALLAYRARSWPALVAKVKAMCEGQVNPYSAEEAESLIDDILALAGEAA